MWILPWTKRKRLPRESWEPLRAYILRRDGYRCQFRHLGGIGPKCNRPAQHVDHIVPVAVGGSDDPENLRASCARCNLRKGSRPPIGWRLKQGGTAIAVLVVVGAVLGFALAGRAFGWGVVWQVVAMGMGAR